MQNTLRLIGTSGCHLCDEAEQLLQELQLPYETIEIMDHADYLTDYELKIPVLLNARSVTQKEALCWPFDKSAVIAWLNQAHPF